jgi:subtilisin family serine protease
MPSLLAVPEGQGHGSCVRGVASVSVRIGIVDTGIDANHPFFKRRKPRGVGVRCRGGGFEYEVDFHDYHGHGTTVASLIRSFCRKAQIYAVRITQQDANGVLARVCEQALARGIEWCVDQGIRIVNVSYSIAEAAEDGSLARACRKAHEKGTVLVAAYRNGEEGPVYPAVFPTVIGVRCRTDLKPGQVAILNENNLDLYAWGTSNSLACAQVSAMVGRIHTVDDCYGLEEVFEFLKEVAVP